MSFAVVEKKEAKMTRNGTKRNELLYFAYATLFALAKPKVKFNVYL